MRRGDFLWLAVFAIFSCILLVPAGRQIFISITNAHPYIMGFVKFALLATMGEMLAIRIGIGEWKNPPGVVYRAIIWGLIGMLVVLVFEIFLSGVRGAILKGLLWAGNDSIAKYLVPLLISVIMNLIFAPTFMIAHRVTDTYIDLICGEGMPLSNVNVTAVIARIDWQGLISFVVMKTIPFFWIPAHTITFLMPPEYRVLAAAYLAIALGVILSSAKKRNSRVGQIGTA